ncbi:MAG: molybdopterin-dependent oxidoreductase [Deltaproteobacteria bacterium]|nr:molybdopterin-dependent oxidoreductase [Deltaproteobacteria bacterium]
MAQHALSTCTLCEAACGIVVTHHEGQVERIVGDEKDPQSLGYICPKAIALADLHHDPDRLRRPLVRANRDEPFREATWAEALRLAGEQLANVQHTHGRDALAVYYGNPVAHNLGLLTHGLAFTRALRTRNLYSASSADQFPQMLASERMYGHFGLIPVPDIDRTQYLLVIGANPIVSNGSIMTAPDMRRRIQDLRARGGRLVVLDPRRTETAELADEHHFVRPGTDAFVLASMLHVLVQEGRVRLGPLGPITDGVHAVGRALLPFSPDATASQTGLSAEVVTRLARDFASQSSSVAYGRLGLCTQEHGTLASWLLQLLNLFAGRLDAVGGAMFTKPAFDLLGLLERVGVGQGFDRWRTRVRGLREIAGESPVATLADEIETPGRGQVRALLTIAGNPVLSAPNGQRLDRALRGLDFVVCVDSYLNETTRHANVILPPVSQLERGHYDLALQVFAVRNGAKYSPPVLQKSPGSLHDWEILTHLSAWLLLPKHTPESLRTATLSAALKVTPEHILDAGLRAGPYKLTLDSLRKNPHGIDLGALTPRLPSILGTPRKRIRAAPPRCLSELSRLAVTVHDLEPASDALLLVGRRHLRSNNSWLHNSHRLVKGPERCVLLVHPEDALRRGITDKSLATVKSRVGEVRVRCALTDEIMKGVVSLPHGWGHTHAGLRMGVAQAHAGVSLNDLTDDLQLDRLSGTAGFSAVAVVVSPASQQDPPVLPSEAPHE